MGFCHTFMEELVFSCLRVWSNCPRPSFDYGVEKPYSEVRIILNEYWDAFVGLEGLEVELWSVSLLV